MTQNQNKPGETSPAEHLNIIPKTVDSQPADPYNKDMNRTTYTGAATMTTTAATIAFPLAADFAPTTTTDTYWMFTNYSADAPLVPGKTFHAQVWPDTTGHYALSIQMMWVDADGVPDRFVAPRRFRSQLEGEAVLRGFLANPTRKTAHA